MTAVAAAVARAEEALAILRAAKHCDDMQLRVSPYGAHIETPGGLGLAFLSDSAIYGDGADAQSVEEAAALARLFCAAPRLLEQLAADVVALAERVRE